MIDAGRLYVANGVVRWAAERAFWPLLFTRLVTEVRLSPLQLVLLGTVYEAAIFLSEIPTGVVADVYSRRLSVIISYLVGGAAFIMSAAVDGYALLVVSQVLVGIGSTFHSGAETAWVTDEVGSATEVEPIILRRGKVQLAAAVAGIAVFSALAAVTSLSVALGAAGVLLMVWGVLLAVVMPERGFERTEGEGWQQFMTMVRSGFDQVRRVPALRVLVIVVVIGGVAKEAIDRLDIQRLADVGLPVDTDEALVVGVLVAARLLFSAALLVAAHRRVQGATVVPVIVALLVGTAVGIALLAHVELLAIAALGMVLQGGFHGATEPLVAIWTNAFAESRVRATIHSFMGQGESIGEVVGGVVLGTVAQVFTVPTAMTISCVLFLVAAVVAANGRSLQFPSGP